MNRTLTNISKWVMICYFEILVMYSELLEKIYRN